MGDSTGCRPPLSTLRCGTDRASHGTDRVNPAPDGAEASSWLGRRRNKRRSDSEWNRSSIGEPRLGLSPARNREKDKREGHSPQRSAVVPSGATRRWGSTKRWQGPLGPIPARAYFLALLWTPRSLPGTESRDGSFCHWACSLLGIARHDSLSTNFTSIKRC